MKKTFLAAAVALGALAVTVPAQADPRGADYGYSQRGEYRGDYGDHGRGGYRHTFSREDLHRLQARIDRGFENGRLTRREAQRLSWQVNDLRQRARHYWRTDGMTWRERQDLDARFSRLREAVRYQLRDGDTRYSEYRGPYRY